MILYFNITAAVKLKAFSVWFFSIDYKIKKKRSCLSTLTLQHVQVEERYRGFFIWNINTWALLPTTIRWSTLDYSYSVYYFLGQLSHLACYCMEGRHWMLCVSLSSGEFSLHKGFLYELWGEVKCCSAIKLKHHEGAAWSEKIKAETYFRRILYRNTTFYRLPKKCLVLVWRNWIGLLIDFRLHVQGCLATLLAFPHDSKKYWTNINASV